jgi:CheY-like chemotaxis protein/serine phosphatase RsbU (regulator of sigma subunit)
MKKNLRILLLEENRENTLLIHKTLSQSGIEYLLNVVHSGGNFSRELENYQPDIVISDRSGNGYTEADAPDEISGLMKEKSPATPHIFITSESHAVREIVHGHEIPEEYLPVSELVKLPGTIEAALSWIEIHKEHEANLKICRKLADAFSEIEEKSKRLPSDFTYAEHIKEFMLPRVDVLRKTFPDSFLLFRPRQISSGDFYWFGEYQSTFVMVTADCSRHGISCGLFSMIGHCLLNMIVGMKGITQPGKIITHLRGGLCHFLKKDEDIATNENGMDIAVCTIDLDNNLLRFAGSNRSMFFVSSTAPEMPDGNREDTFSETDGFYPEFISQERHFTSGDSVYMFSDGYVDQPEALSSKPISSGQLFSWLRSMTDWTLADQETTLGLLFDDWKGIQEQKDDMILIGVRLCRAEVERNFYDSSV